MRKSSNYEFLPAFAPNVTNRLSWRHFNVSLKRKWHESERVCFLKVNEQTKFVRFSPPKLNSSFLFLKWRICQDCCHQIRQEGVRQNGWQFLEGACRLLPKFQSKLWSTTVQRCKTHLLCAGNKTAFAASTVRTICYLKVKVQKKQLCLSFIGRLFFQKQSLKSQLINK